jgi:hypothetical protein
MTSLIIDATRMEVTGKFDSRRRFLRVTAGFRDAYFSRGETFNFNWGDVTGGNFVAWRYKNGPVEVSTELAGSGYFPPAIADTSVGVTF